MFKLRNTPSHCKVTCLIEFQTQLISHRQYYLLKKEGVTPPLNYALFQRLPSAVLRRARPASTLVPGLRYL
jgi:hypothetical protein